MSRSISQRAFMVFGGLALAGTLALAQAAPVSFQVPLTGAQQVPPVQTPGSGSSASHVRPQHAGRNLERQL